MPYVGYHPDRVKWALFLLLFFLVGYSEGDGATEDDFQRWHLPDGAVARLGKGDFRSVAFLGNDRFLRVITGSGVWVYEVATSRTLAFFPTGRVKSIAISPNGTTVATGSDHTVQLWDAVTGENIATLEGHESQTGELDNYVWTLSFSPDGVLLASGAGDGIILWDVATRTEVAALPARMGPVTARITFSPDGTTIFARTGGCNYRLWDVEAKVEIDTPVLAPLMPSELQSRGGAILSPDATLVACTVWNWDQDAVDRVEVWNLRTGEKIVTLRAYGCLEGRLLFSPDGTSLACGSDWNGFLLWEVESWNRVPIEERDRESISISFSPDGTTLASARRDGTVKLWDVATGKSIATIEGHESVVLSVSFSSDGATLASGSSDGTVKLWDTETWQRTTTFSGHEGDFSAMAFSPDGTTLATGSWNGVELWDMDTLNAVRMSHSLVYRVAFSPDGTTLATGSGGRIDLWNLSTGQRSNIGCGGGSPFAFADDGMLAVGCEETIRFWDVTLGDWVAIVDGLTAGVASVAVSPDGSLAAGLQDGTVHLRDVQKGEWVGILEADRRGLGVLFSPDGAILASASSGTVCLWDVTSQERVAILEGQEYGITPMAFSPDGTIFAYGSRGESKLWDIAEQTAIASFGGHAGDWVKSVAFSPDGGTLASSSVNMILLWDMSPYIRSAPTAIQSPFSPLPRPTALLGNFPNPFNTTTLIEYHLAEPGGVRLVIHNALGQPVRTLVDDSRGAGHHSVEWDAHDDGSTLVASGVYLARLSHPGGAQTRRLMFLK